MHTYVRVGCIVALWTISFVLMVVRTVDYDNTTLSPLTGWAILLAVWAAVVTGWQLLLCERHRVNEIAQMLAGASNQLKPVD